MRLALRDLPEKASRRECQLTACASTSSVLLDPAARNLR